MRFLVGKLTTQNNKLPQYTTKTFRMAYYAIIVTTLAEPFIGKEMQNETYSCRFQSNKDLLESSCNIQNSLLDCANMSIYG